MWETNQEYIRLCEAARRSLKQDKERQHREFKGRGWRMGIVLFGAQRSRGGLGLSAGKRLYHSRQPASRLQTLVAYLHGE